MRGAGVVAFALVVAALALVGCGRGVDREGGFR